MSVVGKLTQTKTDESSRLCSCWGLTGGKSRLGCPRGRALQSRGCLEHVHHSSCTELSSHGHLPLEARGSAIKPCVRGSLLSCPATRQHSHTALQINQLPVICNKPQLSCGAILLHAQHQSLLLHASWLLPLAHYLLLQRSHHLFTCRVTYCPSLFPISTSLSWSCSTSCIPTRPRSFPSPILYIRAQTTESKLVSSATHSSTQP